MKNNNYTEENDLVLSSLGSKKKHFEKEILDRQDKIDKIQKLIDDIGNGEKGVQDVELKKREYNK